MLENLKKIIESPITNLVVALILFMTGLSEAWESLADDIHNKHFGLHHGIMIYALFHALRSIPDIFEGIERAHRAKKKQ